MKKCQIAFQHMVIHVLLNVRYNTLTNAVHNNVMTVSGYTAHEEQAHNQTRNTNHVMHAQLLFDAIYDQLEAMREGAAHSCSNCHQHHSCGERPSVLI